MQGGKAKPEGLDSGARAGNRALSGTLRRPFSYLKSSLSITIAGFSRAKLSPKTAISRRVKSDKLPFKRPENSSKSLKIAVSGDLSLFVPTCGIAKRKAEKAG